MDRHCDRAATALVWLIFAGFPAVAAPVTPSPRPSGPPNPHPAPIVAARARPTPGPGLYGRHARRMVQAYLRLKLLEMRELDLERARSVIERGLGPDALLGPSPFPGVTPPGPGER